jgi:hypothetical protein
LSKASKGLQTRNEASEDEHVDIWGPDFVFNG